MSVIEEVQETTATPTVVTIEQNQVQKDLDAIREMVGDGLWIRNNAGWYGPGCIMGLAHRVAGVEY